MRPVGIVVLVFFFAAAPAGGGGIEVGGETVLLDAGPGENIQATPRVAFGKGVYLAVWREGWHGKAGRARVFAARVDRAGKVLDPKGIEIAASAGGVQVWPRVAFAGGQFLVVWQDLRNGKDFDVLAARISAEGKVVSARPIPLARGEGNQVLPDVASNGREFLVVWQGIVGDGFHKFARRVGPEGALGEPVDLGPGPQPQIAWGGKDYLLVTADIHLQAVRLDPRGKPLDKPARLIGWWHRKTFSVASSGLGQGWLVLSSRTPQPDHWGWGGPGATYCIALGPDGKETPEVLDLFGASKQPKYTLYPYWLDVGERKGKKTWPHRFSAAAWDGKSYVAVWVRANVRHDVELCNHDLYASRVSGCRPQDRPGAGVAVGPGSQTRPALASDARGGLLCVYEKHEANGNVRVVARTLRTAAPR